MRSSAAGARVFVAPVRSSGAHRDHLGVVKDPTGAAVPNVSVTVTNVESNYERTAMTGNDGAYRFRVFRWVTTTSRWN